MFAVVVKNAINDHDRLQAENDRMRAALELIQTIAAPMVGAKVLYVEHWQKVLDETAAALQTCDAQQENANG